jgi:hypothetical protein
LTQPTDILTEAEIAELEKAEREATAGEWFYNSYSAIFSVPMLEPSERLRDEWEAAGYPEADSHRDGEWFNRILSVEPRIAEVPPHHGDTAIGRQRADAHFIALARNQMPRLLASYRALEKERDALKAVLKDADLDLRNATNLLRQASEERDALRSALTVIAEREWPNGRLVEFARKALGEGEAPKTKTPR